MIPGPDELGIRLPEQAIDQVLAEFLAEFLEETHAELKKQFAYEPEGNPHRGLQQP